MLIQSHDRHQEVGSFSPSTGELKLFRRWRATNLHEPLRGHYSRLGKHFVMLWRGTDGLHLLVDFSDFLLSPEVTVHWCRIDAGHAEFRVHGVPEIVVTYSSDLKRQQLWTSQAIMGSIEDWDFGLFVHNVMNDPGRGARIYTNEASAK